MARAVRERNEKSNSVMRSLERSLLGKRKAKRERSGKSKEFRDAVVEMMIVFDRLTFEFSGMFDNKKKIERPFGYRIL